MKKIHSFICLAAAALLAMSFTACSVEDNANPNPTTPTEPEVLFEQNYTVMLQTNSAPYEPTEVQVEVKENTDHTFNIKVVNWTVGMYNGAYKLGFGTFELANLEGTKSGDIYTVSGTVSTEIVEGDATGVMMWNARAMNPNHVTINAKFTAEKFYATGNFDAYEYGQNYRLAFGEEF